MSLYSHLDQLPDDPILKIPLLFKADARPERLNLGIGAYQDETGQPVVFAAVREAEKRLLELSLNKEYPPIGGDSDFCRLATELVLGESPEARMPLLALQTVGASAALRIAGDFLASRGIEVIAVPRPTWSNHYGLLQRGAGLAAIEYPYCDTSSGLFAADACLAVLKQLPPHTAILLQACCHNPSGSDPMPDQWDAIQDICRERHLIPLFDLAYQGLGANLADDAYAVRSFIDAQLEVLITVSFSKNFGLYGERVGLLLATAQETATIPKIASHCKSLIRGTYSMPPLQGARIVKTILGDPGLRDMWQDELTFIRSRVQAMRQGLSQGLQHKHPAGDYRALRDGQGFFAFSGLTLHQVLWLRSERAIYLPDDGRLNLAGLNDHNLPLVIDALAAARSI